MVLASADMSTTLNNLAYMADKIMEVAAHTVAAVSTTCIDDSTIKQLREEVLRYTDLVASPLHPLQDPPATNTPPPANLLLKKASLLVSCQVWC